MDQFLNYLQQQELQPETLYQYKNSIERFFSWYEKKHGTPVNLTELTQEDLHEYKFHLEHNLKFSASTINKNLSAVRKWLKWIKKNGQWKGNIHIPDMPIEAKKSPTIHLTDQEVHSIIQVLEKKNDFLHTRDKSIMFLCLYAALRITEVMNLQLDDIDLTRRKIIVRSQSKKGDQELPIYSKKLIQALNEWLNIRECSRFTNSENLFISLRSEGITIGAINKMVNRIVKESHVQFTTQQLRHTCLSKINQITRDLNIVALFSRHQHIDNSYISTPSIKKDMDLLRNTEIYE